MMTIQLSNAQVELLTQMVQEEQIRISRKAGSMPYRSQILSSLKAIEDKLVVENQQA